MPYSASGKFWLAYRALPSAVRETADKNFALLKNDPRHPSLRLKRIGRFWSVRVGEDYRSLGVDIEGGILRFWIGSHSEYEKLIRS